MEDREKEIAEEQEIYQFNNTDPDRKLDRNEFMRKYENQYK